MKPIMTPYEATIKDVRAQENREAFQGLCTLVIYASLAVFTLIIGLTGGILLLIAFQHAH